jgi:hypothetical protein
MFESGERLCKDVCPVEIHVNFNYFDLTLPNLILEMMPFQRNVLGAYFCTVLEGKDYT